jgi:hypothetical protein
VTSGPVTSGAGADPPAITPSWATGSPGLPIAADTVDLRAGRPLNDALLALLPLIGEWEGIGTGAYPTLDAPFRYGQRISFAHDGRPFLAYESRTWLIDDAGSVIRPASREVGFWRPGAGPDDIELVTCLPTGVAEVFSGVAGDQRWELETVSVGTTATAKQVSGERRIYAVLEDALVYATELAAVGQPFAPHLNASLQRI